MVHAISFRSQAIFLVVVWVVWYPRYRTDDLKMLASLIALGVALGVAVVRHVETFEGCGWQSQGRHKRRIDGLTSIARGIL